MSEGEPHEEDKSGASSDHINLKVSGQDGAEVHFKIKRTTQLKKLMDAYCQRQGKNPASVRFLLDGVRIEGTQTPKELGMEENDTIDAVLQQTGGH